MIFLKFWLIWCKVFQDYIFGTVSKIKNGFDGGNIICWFIIAGHKCQDIVNCKKHMRTNLENQKLEKVVKIMLHAASSFGHKMCKL